MNKSALYNKIAGFVDGEGSFSITYTPKSKDRKYKHLNFRFGIMIVEEDKDLLKMIKKVLGCGEVYKVKPRQRAGIYNCKPQCLYTVNSFNDLVNKVIPFFDKYTLMSKKRYAYFIWKQAIEIGKNRKKRGWDNQEIKEILRLRDLMGQRRLTN